jgi:hypothetical protein
MPYCLYKHRSGQIDRSPNNRINTIYFYLNFTLVFYFSLIRSGIHQFNHFDCCGSCLSFIHTSLDWRRSSLVEGRRRPWLPSESTKLNHPICQIGQSNFYSFGQGLSAPDRFMWQQDALLERSSLICPPYIKLTHACWPLPHFAKFLDPCARSS